MPRGKEQLVQSLVGQAGLVLRPRNPGAGWIGDVETESVDDGLRVSEVVPFDTPMESCTSQAT